MVSDPNLRLAQIAEKGVDFDSRTIYVNGEVDGKMLLQIPALRIMDETEGQITIVINSHGGDSDVGVALYDSIRSLRNPSVAINVSKAFSIAALILQGAQTRLILPHAEVMIHNGYLVTGTVEVDNDDIQDMIDQSKRSDEVYHKIIAERTGLPLSKIQHWCETDTYFSSQEALKYHFVDSIVNAKFLKPVKVKNGSPKR